MTHEIKIVQILKFVTIHEVEASNLKDAIDKAECINPILSIEDGDEMNRVSICPSEESGLIYIHENDIESEFEAKMYENGKIAISWSIEDIMSEDRPDIEADDARMILYRLKNKHDADVGINWATIETHVDMYREDRQKIVAKSINGQLSKVMANTISSIDDYKKFLTACLMDIGQGFHPDTPFEDYIDSNGRPVFTTNQSKALNHLMAEVFEYSVIEDVYGYCMEQWARIEMSRIGYDQDIRILNPFRHFPIGTSEAKIIDWFETEFDTDYFTT